MAVKLIQGDCMAAMSKLKDNSVDLIVTDPPYAIETAGGGAFGGRTFYSELDPIKNGFTAEVLDEMCRVMKKVNCYIWCSQKQLPILIDYFVKGRKCNWNLLTWHKTNPVPACGNKYLTDTEFLFFAREKGVKIYGEYATKKTYYVTPLNTADKKKWNHPTIKPIDILENLIVNSSNEGDIILDPFMGSGSTGVACQNTHRNFIGIELEPQYIEIAKERTKIA